jgi:hypothetical protein
VSEKQAGLMTIGLVSMPLSGHLNPMTALACRLQSRGNEVVFRGVPEVEPFACAAGLENQAAEDQETQVHLRVEVRLSISNPENSALVEVSSSSHCLYPFVFNALQMAFVLHFPFTSAGAMAAKAAHRDDRDLCHTKHNR